MPCCDDKLYMYITQLIKVAFERGSMEWGLGQEKNVLKVLKDSMIYICFNWHEQW